jgi:nucleoredoxin
MKSLYLLLLALLSVMSLRAALPPEVTLTKPTKFEILRDGILSGSIDLAPGTKLAVVDLADDYLIVRYRNASGRVLPANTNLPPEALMGEEAASLNSGGNSHPSAGRTANTMEKALSGKMVHLENGAIRPFDRKHLAEVKFYALYFSASWCPPCRAFTPSLVEAYGKIREQFPEFELVLVNHDQSPEEMEAYMRGDAMRWPALNWHAIASAPEINSYGGDGIPDLVLVDENGRVLSDSYRNGNYVGPHAVLNDIWKILRNYREQNPRS